MFSSISFIFFLFYVAPGGPQVMHNPAINQVPQQIQQQMPQQLPQQLPQHLQAAQNELLGL